MDISLSLSAGKELICLKCDQEIKEISKYYINENSALRSRNFYFSLFLSSELLTPTIKIIFRKQICPSNRAEFFFVLAKYLPKT